tara:strand:- start:520 stop:990 length:471 start_codon:yes stop_codon:yes gene_type:complete
MNNFNMFGKNNEPITSSERTHNLKNKILYKNHTPNINTSFKNHEYYHNLIKGFIECKKVNKISSDNSGCFDIWLNDELDNIEIKTIDDWNVSKIDYESIASNDTSLQDTGTWPYTSTNKKELIYDKYSYFDSTNTKNITIYAKNFKYIISRSLINL